MALRALELAIIVPAAIAVKSSYPSSINATLEALQWPWSLAHRDVSGMGMFVETTVSGARAKEIPIKDFPSCQTLQSTADEHKFVCAYRFSDPSVATPGVDISSIRQMNETWLQGDYFVHETQSGFGVVPYPFNLYGLPKQLPKIIMACPMCGGICDTRLSTTSPELFKIYLRMESILEGWAAQSGRPPLRDRKKIVEMPACPLTTSPADPPDKYGFDSSVTLMDPAAMNAKTEVPASLKGMWQQMMAAVDVNSETTYSMHRADGTIVYKIHQKSHVGQI